MISNHILNDFCVSDLVCPFRPWRFRYDNIYIDIILDFILTRPFFLYPIPLFPQKGIRNPKVLILLAHSELLIKS